MFAFVGYIVHANGIHFPWPMQMDGTGFPTSTNPPELWDTISDSAKWQIFSVIAFLEFWSELSTPSNKHYMAGGRPGDFPDFQTGTSKLRQQKPSEIKSNPAPLPHRNRRHPSPCPLQLLRSLQMEQKNVRRKEGGKIAYGTAKKLYNKIPTRLFA